MRQFTLDPDKVIIKQNMKTVLEVECELWPNETIYKSELVNIKIVDRFTEGIGGCYRVTISHRQEFEEYKNYIQNEVIIFDKHIYLENPAYSLVFVIKCNQRLIDNLTILLKYLINFDIRILYC